MLKQSNTKDVMRMIGEKSTGSQWQVVREGAFFLGLIGFGCMLALVVLEISLRIFWIPELTSTPGRK